MGTQLPSHKGAQSPQFSAHCRGQMAGWIKMPQGMEVRLGSGSAPRSPKRGPSPQFLACLLWPNGWMYQDATWHGGGPRFRPHCARWGPSSPPQKVGRAPLPNFQSITIVAKVPNGCMYQDIPHGTEAGLNLGDIV